MSHEPEDLLEEINAIIKADIKRIGQISKTEKLDHTSAANLVNYAKLQLAVDKHHRDIEADEERRALEESEFREALAKVAGNPLAKLPKGEE